MMFPVTINGLLDGILLWALATSAVVFSLATLYGLWLALARLETWVRIEFVRKQGR